MTRQSDHLSGGGQNSHPDRCQIITDDREDTCPGVLGVKGLRDENLQASSPTVQWLP